MAYETDDGGAVASRRKSPRVDGPFEAHRVGGASSAHLRVMNISVGGCLIESLHKEKAGDRYTLEIELPGVGTITVNAETLHVRGHEIAVRFLDVSDDTRRAIHGVVRNLRAKSAEKGAARK